MALVAPLTSKSKDIRSHYKLENKGLTSNVMLEHVKVISTKRLTRKIRRLDKFIFEEIKSLFVSLIF
ncbi:MAG: type II toxin-antitoxin system PemK/MazF family toxin [Candidatus Pacebacteria bacterium]|nr:type II toxin-antitoxin system PemK/MazF family toxin [Candidatus Paceibacterota bacterium]